MLQSPLWYIAVIVLLTGLTTYVRVWWWLTGLVAVVWGGWLLWQTFAGESELHQSTQKGDASAGYLQQALIYQAQIEQFLELNGKRHHYLEPQQLRQQIDSWVTAIRQFEQQMTSLQQNRLVQQDLSAVPQAITELESHLAEETDETTRRHLERSLHTRREQLAALNLLTETTHQAEIRLENMVSRLGTIYSHLLTSQSTDQTTDYHRCTAEVNEELLQLQDHLEALQEVRRYG